MSENPESRTALLPVDFDPFGEPSAAAFELTEPQRELLAVTQMGDAANCAYNQVFALRLRGALSQQSLHNALAQVVQRHEALRLRIDVEAERQQTLPSIAVALPLVDLRDVDPARRDATIIELLDRETRTPFDLNTAPLWRAQLVREGADLHRFIFTAHHVIADGWSSAVILGDLARAYAADRFGLPARQPEPASYRKFVAEGRTEAAIEEVGEIGRAHV